MIDELDLKLEMSASDPAEIIRFIKSIKSAENKKVDGLYFLDIELDNEQNGINVAQAIREYDPMGTIAFITSHSHYRKLTFKYNVEAVDYILKGDEDELHERIKACINRACQKYASRHEGTFYNFKLPKNNFYRCHRSCIVNLHNLTKTCKDELMQGKAAVTMSNGAECKKLYSTLGMLDWRDDFMPIKAILTTHVLETHKEKLTKSGEKSSVKTAFQCVEYSFLTYQS